MQNSCPAMGELPPCRQCGLHGPDGPAGRDGLDGEAYREGQAEPGCAAVRPHSGAGSPWKLLSGCINRAGDGAPTKTSFSCRNGALAAIHEVRRLRPSIENSICPDFLILVAEVQTPGRS